MPTSTRRVTDTWFRTRERVAAHHLFQLDPGHIDGNPLSGDGTGLGPHVNLQSTYLDASPRRLQREVVVDRNRPGREGTGDHGSEPSHGEHAINGKPWGPI